MALYKPAYAQALALLRDMIPREPQVEVVPVPEALGRVLAADVRAARDFPESAVSLKDGVARSEDGRSIPIRTGEELPAWAIDVVAHEDLASAGSSERGRSAAERPDFLSRGAEATAGDVLVPCGAALGFSDIARLHSFGIGAVDAVRMPRIQIAVFSEAPFGDAVASYLTGYAAAFARADIDVARVARPRDVDLPRDGFDIGIIASDGAPGRYDEIKGLASGALEGFEPAFWKAAIHPCKHTALGQMGGRPVLVFPDIFSKTVLAAMAFLTPALGMWFASRPRKRSARFDKGPALPYPLPCVVPVAWGDSGEAEPLPLTSSFSARHLCRADAYAVIETTPVPENVELTVIGPLAGRAVP